MVIKTLQLNNWRSLKELQLILGPGLNLVCGPNESGKSTLREALRAAFLTPSRGRGKHPLSATRPWDTPKAFPRIELTFHHQGADWRMVRVFFAEGCLLEKDGRVIAKDDAVLNALDGGAAALWTVQGDVEPPTVPSEMRAQLSASEAVSPGITWLEARLNELAETWWTPTGRPKKSLADARTELARLEGERDQLKEELARADRLSDEVVFLRSELDAIKAQEQVLANELELQRPLLGAWDKYRTDLAERKVVEQDVKQLTVWLTRWAEQQGYLGRLWPELQGYATRVEALKSQPAPSRESVDQLQLRMRYAQARIQQSLREELESLAAPTADQVARLEGLEGRLQGLEAQGWDAELAALGTLQAELDGEPVALEAGQIRQWKSSAGFTLQFPGLARLTLRGGSADALETMRKERLELLASWRVNSLPEGRERQQRAAHLSARLAGLPHLDLTELRSLYHDWAAVDRLRTEELQAELEALPGRIASAEAEWREAAARHESIERQLRELLANNPAPLVDQCQQQLRQLATEQSVELPDPPEPAQLDLTAARIRVRLGERNAVLTEPPHPPQGQEVSHDALRAQEQKLEDVRQKATELATQLSERVGRLDQYRELYPRWVRAEETYHREAELQARREVDASSLRLLQELFQAARQQLESDVVGPLRGRIEARLHRLTGARYRAVDLKPDFRADGLVTDAGYTAGLGDLSFGTREQVAFLARLCLAELLSEKERHLAVFDDSLVHTDQHRMELACRLLEEAAESAQLLVLTCHPERFPGLKANVLTL